MSDRVWPAMTRLQQLDTHGPHLYGRIRLPDRWLPEVGERLPRLRVSRLTSLLIAHAERVVDGLPGPEAVTGRARIAWALGCTPGHVDRLYTGETQHPVQVAELAVLFALTNIDRPGLEEALGAPTLLSLVSIVGGEDGFVREAAQREAGTVAASRGWVARAADRLGLSILDVDAALASGTVSWVPGATPACGLAASRQVLADPARPAVWVRRLLAPDVADGQPPVARFTLDGSASLADVAATMRPRTGGGAPEPVWEWRVPATGLALTPPTVRHGRLALTMLDLRASPDPKPDQPGPEAVTDSTRVVAVDAIPAGGSALLTDARHDPPRPVALYTVNASQ